MNKCIHKSEETKLKSNRNRSNLINVLPIFSRHETFHPRFGWLKKGFDKALKYPDLFRRKDAPVILGVGKNMVRAIRYWCNAFKVLIEEERGKKRLKHCVPSEFGSRLLDNGGWDPYLEDTASLWLLHWNLLKFPCQAASWFFAFNVFRHREFTSDDILSGLTEYKEVKFPDSRAVLSSLRKDVSCLLRMYVEHHQEGLIEDTVNSPFMELGLIKQAGDSKHHQFNFNKKINLPAEIIVAVCLEYASLIGNQARTINISRLLYDIGSPGLVFKLTQSTLIEAIEEISLSLKQVSISDMAGVIQLSYKDDPFVLKERILETYYNDRPDGRKKT